jgi:pimeloyl-ACP methyl ester carboxylesterase
MTDYVLIHGAWHGSWCWTRVRRLLAAGAHRVFTPTLTGVGERSHLLSRDVGLDTHVADIANLMIWEELRVVVLVGHSYGGVVARHVADRMPDRISSLVYLDAFVPDNGKALFDYLPDSGNSDRELAETHGDGWKVPPRPASFFAVNAADAAWVDRQCTMHPLSTFEAPAQISGACDGIATIGYIVARGFESPFGQFYDKAAERRWWQAELACGHDVMLDMPNEAHGPAAAADVDRSPIIKLRDVDQLQRAGLYSRAFAGIEERLARLSRRPRKGIGCLLRPTA